MLIWLTLIIPASCIILTTLLQSPRSILLLCVLGSLSSSASVLILVMHGLVTPIFAASRQLMVDSLSSFHLLLVSGIFTLSSIYAGYYFLSPAKRMSFGNDKARRFGICWFSFLTSMLLVLTANNLGLMWVGMEATTIASAVLVCLEFDRSSVRAAWTYLMMCSVGIALALLGIFILCSEGRAASLSGESVFLWTELYHLTHRMKPDPVRMAFLFILIGYGTKAGLAPMHNWLPDAHSQAPTPVSAVLSGVLLNCALYSLCRFLPLVEGVSGGQGWAFHLLIPFGIISILIAAIFIIHETDIKRLLAFHSVEHMGIIALGLGVGGTTAALYHTFNHSICKMLTFFCAGTIAQHYETRDMRSIKGVLSSTPSAGFGLVCGILALIGLPPFSIFMSEIWIVQVGIKNGHLGAIVFFLIGAASVFISALKHVMEMVWHSPQKGSPTDPLLTNKSATEIGWPLVAFPLLLLAITGIWMPARAKGVLEQAGAIINRSNNLI